MASEKPTVNYNGTETEYQTTYPVEQRHSALRDREVRPVKINLNPSGLPPSSITGAISVRNNMKDELYPKPDMGPQGASKPWIPPGRR